MLYSLINCINSHTSLYACARGQHIVCIHEALNVNKLLARYACMHALVVREVAERFLIEHVYVRPHYMSYATLLYTIQYNFELSYITLFSITCEPFTAVDSLDVNHCTFFCAIDTLLLIIILGCELYVHMHTIYIIII